MKEDMGMKREWDPNEVAKRFDIANCLMLLSHNKSPQKRVEFECKTCKRKFASFQALGGHRASHKRPRLDDDHNELKAQAKCLSLATKPKMHECSICGLQFSLGQALGGHIRRHKASSDTSHNHVVRKVPIFKRSNSSNSKRVFCLDLNLSPLQNDLNILFGNKAPKIDAHFF